MEDLREAQAATLLAEIEEGHAAAADMRPRRWYHPALGIVAGAVVVFFALGVSWAISTLVIAIGVGRILAEVHRFSTGVTFSPFLSGRRALVWSLAYLVVAVGMGVLAWQIGIHPHPGGVALALASGVVTLLLTIGYGVGFERVRRRAV